MPEASTDLSENRCIFQVFWYQLTIKYEELYINEYKDINEIKIAISEYMEFCNKSRIHSILDYETPDRF